MTVIPDGQQADGPSIACVYDYLLGGSHNFAADQEAARGFLARWPDAPATMRANRAFLGRAVRHLAGQAGIRQFLDIGSGIPTMGNVHEIAQQAAPDTRVVYVDNDAVAVQHSRAILARNDNAIAIQADLRRPREILDDPQLQDLLDLSRPAALLLVAILHFFPDSDEPAALVAGLRDALAPGSSATRAAGSSESGKKCRIATSSSAAGWDRSSRSRSWGLSRISRGRRKSAWTAIARSLRARIARLCRTATSSLST